MIINIQDDLFAKVLNIVRLNNTALYNQIKDIKTLPDLNTVDTLAKARTIKTDRIKERIKSSIRELLQAKEQPTRYKVHKQTSITYSTLKKYYDEIFDEVQLER